MEEADFFSKIKKFNEMYRVDNNDRPTLLEVERLENFKKILLEEVHEVDEIIGSYKNAISEGKDLSHEKKVEILTSISDWLGDLVVYSTSEARRFGVDMEKILHIIMESNFSKLGEDGKPIIDERGKIMKGPNYWKPEPKISEFLGNELKKD